MKQSNFFTKTSKQMPKDEQAKNAQYLIRAGFIFKEMAGVYTYLPLGLRVLNKISNIIREEMNKIGSQEIFMTVLQEKGVWEKTNRWNDDVVDNWFKTKLKNNTELGLGFTHEESVARIMKNFISSYKDLPFSVYQIQTKFRNEARAKAGLMRGREFFMKDLYSFSRNKEEHEKFYEKMKDVYMSVFKRLGLADKTYLTVSSGGSFSKYSYEFQTISEAGEDIIYIDEEKNIAINKDDFNDEIIKDFNLNPDKSKMRKEKSIEIGDIYSLGYKYSKAFDLKYKNEKGEDEYVYMGSYGMSPSRLMGAIVELNSDENGIIWPENVAPFKIHLLQISDDENVKKRAENLYFALQEKGFEVLYDDRNIGAGAKFFDADLIGCPIRLLVSPKTLKESSVELKYRRSKDTELVHIDKILDYKFRV